MLDVKKGSWHGKVDAIMDSVLTRADPSRYTVWVDPMVDQSLVIVNVVDLDAAKSEMYIIHLNLDDIPKKLTREVVLLDEETFLELERPRLDAEALNSIYSDLIDFTVKPTT